MLHVRIQPRDNREAFTLCGVIPDPESDISPTIAASVPSEHLESLGVCPVCLSRLRPFDHPPAWLAERLEEKRPPTRRGKRPARGNEDRRDIYLRNLHGRALSRLPKLKSRRNHDSCG